ncbi:MAG: porin, partial [Gammaproteobacteria bacterium]|nr:porin [Gammaproteobacteria bacterium]
LGWVELSGDFGSVKIGNQWSAFFNAVGTYMSPTFSLGYYLGSSIGTKPLRTSNTIKYSNSVGPVSFAIDARISSDGAGGDLEKNISRDRGEDIDGIGIGVSFAVNDSLTIGLAVDSDFYDIDPDTGLNRDDDDRIAVGASYAWGDHHVDVAWYSIDEGVKSGVQGRDEDTASIYYHGTWGMNKLMVGYLIADDGPNAEPSQLTLNFYHKMGGGFQTYVESAWVDADNGPTFGNDFNHIILGMRYDF